MMPSITSIILARGVIASEARQSHEIAEPVPRLTLRLLRHKKQSSQ